MSEAESMVRELTLLLAYLTSWDDNPDQQLGPNPIHRAWKTYDARILKNLDNLGMIVHGGESANSFYLTANGVEHARKLMEKYGIEVPEVQD